MHSPRIPLGVSKLAGTLLAGTWLLKAQGARESMWPQICCGMSVCHSEDVEKKQRFPLVHSVKPNQYTASVPKGNVENKKKAPISTQRQAQLAHSISGKRRC